MDSQYKQKKRAPEYESYHHMKARCLNKKNKDYYNYGARGISIWGKWLGLEGYANFLEDMGRRPDIGYSLDRIDSSGNYSKANCRWATNKEQAVNHRRNWIVWINSEWVDSKRAAIILNVPYVTLANSMRGAQPIPKRFKDLVYRRREITL